MPSRSRCLGSAQDVFKNGKKVRKVEKGSKSGKRVEKWKKGRKVEKGSKSGKRVEKWKKGRKVEKGSKSGKRIEKWKKVRKVEYLGQFPTKKGIESAITCRSLFRVHLSADLGASAGRGRSPDATQIWNARSGVDLWTDHQNFQRNRADSKNGACILFF